MKKTLLAIALTASFAGSAFAADLPMKARPMGPAPVVGYNWTGCYLGAGGGYGMFDQRHRTIDPFGVPFTAGETDTGGKGWFGTVQVGCDYQFAERWLIGAFADYDFSDIKGNFQPTGIVGAGGLGVYGEEKLKSSWAVGGRVGYLVFPKLLTYVAGGYTEARFDGVAFSNLLNNTPTIGSMAPQTYKGWFLATGYEYGIDFLPGLFWKSEYRYSNYGAENPAITVPPTALVGAPTLIGTENSRKDVQTIRTELVYRFNFGGGPVVARY
jgi:outer membrane immunogenic protein